MWINQSLHGVEIRNVEGRFIHSVNKLLNHNFNNVKWLAFDYKWFIPDESNGRHNIIKICNKIKNEIYGNGNI